MKSQTNNASLGDKIIKAANKSIRNMLEEKAVNDQYVVFSDGKKIIKVKAKEALKKIDP